MHVLLNAANVTGAGAKVIIASLLPALDHAEQKCQFTILLPDDPQFRSLALPSSSTVRFWKVRRGLANDVARLWDLFKRVKGVCGEVGPDVCVTMGDLAAIGLPCPQIIFFHMPLLVYTQQETGGDGWPWIKRWYLRKHFGLGARRASRIVVQTPVMARRLADTYAVPRERIVEIPQPIPAHVASRAMKAGKNRPLVLPDRIRLLFLAAFYRHKNHAILLAVARELRARGLSRKVQIDVTLDVTDRRSSSLRHELSAESAVIVNLGHLSSDSVVDALSGANALFLPTLVETFGLTYLEAMACGLPILTSDRDFAHWMCRDLADYFDPLDPKSIVDAIERLARTTFDESYWALARQRLASFPADWTSMATRLLGLAAEVVQERR
jgi:glycosyltransferase involved in cell wall biosynthesis